MKQPKIKRPRGRPMSKLLQVAIMRLLEVVEKSMFARENKSWKINDITMITSGDTYITPKKKRVAYQAIGMVREVLKAKHGRLFYSVPGNGYKVMEDVNDHELVLDRWTECTHSIVSSILMPIYESGKTLAVLKPDVREKLGEVRLLLEKLN